MEQLLDGTWCKAGESYIDVEPNAGKLGPTKERSTASFIPEAAV